MQNYGKMKVQLNRLEFGQSNCQERVQGGGALGDNCQLVDQPPPASLLPTRIFSQTSQGAWPSPPSSDLTVCQWRVPVNIHGQDCVSVYTAVQLPSTPPLPSLLHPPLAVDISQAGRGCPSRARLYGKPDSADRALDVQQGQVRTYTSLSTEERSPGPVLERSSQTWTINYSQRSSQFWVY